MLATTKTDLRGVPNPRATARCMRVIRHAASPDLARIYGAASVADLTDRAVPLTAIVGPEHRATQANSEDA